METQPTVEMQSTVETQPMEETQLMEETRPTVEMQSTVETQPMEETRPTVETQPTEEIQRKEMQRTGIQQMVVVIQTAAQPQMKFLLGITLFLNLLMVPKDGLATL